MRLVIAALLLVTLGGCLRTRIDLCAQVPPHPECAALDAGRDAPAPDAPSDAADAGVGDDAGVDDAGLDAD